MADLRYEAPQQQAGPWWMSYLPIALLAVVGLVLTGAAFRQVTGWERQRVGNAFNEAARDRLLVIQREIEHSLSVVQDIASFVEATQWVGRREFRRFVGPVLKRHGGIRALEWVPRVAAAERAAFEEAARVSFPGFQINELRADGSLTEAQGRSDYFPIIYVQPYTANRPALGYDLGADPATRTALAATAAAGEMRVYYTARIGPEAMQGSTFVAQMPVYQKSEGASAEDAGDREYGDDTDGSADAAARRRLRGYAVGAYQIAKIISRAMESLTPSGIDMRFYVLVDGQRRELLYGYASRLRGVAPEAPLDTGRSRSEPAFVGTLQVADRRWEVVCTPVAGRLEVDPWSGWAVLAAGLALSALLTVYLSTLVGRESKVRRLVLERTEQLAATNRALGREIAERVRAQQQLQGLNETLEQRVAQRAAEAERRAEELEQFAYVTSHDLKAPLRGIANLAAWLQEDLQQVLTAETREQLALLRDRVRRMQALIDGLLEYSRIGHSDASRESVDTGALLGEIIDSLAPPPGFAIEVAPGMPTLHTDRLQLGQVFSNLIGNSLKHHGSDVGHVWVQAQERGDSYELSVADDGPGIAPEYHDKVFMVFQTLASKDYGGDTGIGLALVRKIVREHGGRIWLESAPGKGATFRFTWPKDG